MAKIIRTKKPKCLENYKLSKDRKTWILAGENIKWKNNSPQAHIDSKEKIKEALMKMCNNTCPFSFVTKPFVPLRFFEVEHFRPKSKFPQFEFEWNNLFPIYRFPNTQKNIKFPKNLKSPEEIDYLAIMKMNTFIGREKYGHLEPVDNSEDAKLIIDTFDLNHKELVESRIAFFDLSINNNYPFEQLF